MVLVVSVPLWFCILVSVAACSGGDRAIDATATPEGISLAEARSRLQAIVLAPADIGGGYEQAVARARTNEELALERPDSDVARRQYAGWGQVLAYNVQYAAPAGPGLLFDNRTARIMNTATLFSDAAGAAEAMSYVRGLTPDAVEAFLQTGEGGTTLGDLQVTKDIDFPAKGDESFAWRVSGKATFANGFTVNFVADTVFIRVGNVTGNMTTVALGQAPQRPELLSFVDRFIAKAQAGGS